MDIDDADAVNRLDGQNTPSRAAPSRATDAGDGCDGDDWLGCEGLHPLTWLPEPAIELAGTVLLASRR